jgi:hypothetical protein
MQMFPIIKNKAKKYYVAPIVTTFIMTVQDKTLKNWISNILRNFGLGVSALPQSLLIQQWTSSSLKYL